MPIRTVDGSVLFIRDVAHARDGYAPQTNIVTMNDVRAVMMSIEKTGSASTIDIVTRVKNVLSAKISKTVCHPH